MLRLVVSGLIVWALACSDAPDSIAPAPAGAGAAGRGGAAAAGKGGAAGRGEDGVDAGEAVDHDAGPDAETS